MNAQRFKRRYLSYGGCIISSIKPALELEKATKTSKTAYKEALAFLEGAGMVVNEVVVENKVPQSLIQRYGILKDE